MNRSKRTWKNQTDQNDSLGLDEHHGDHFTRASLTLSHSTECENHRGRQTIAEFHIELQSQADFPRRERELKEP